MDCCGARRSRYILWPELVKRDRLRLRLWIYCSSIICLKVINKIKNFMILIFLGSEIKCATVFSVIAIFI